jgi:hypothetical protein
MNDFIDLLLGPEIHPVTNARAVLNLTSKDRDDDDVFYDEHAVFSCLHCGRNDLHLDDFYFKRGKKTRVCKECHKARVAKYQAAKKMGMG